VWRTTAALHIQSRQTRQRLSENPATDAKKPNQHIHDNIPSNFWHNNNRMIILKPVIRSTFRKRHAITTKTVHEKRLAENASWGPRVLWWLMNVFIATVVVSSLLYATAFGPSLKPESIRIGSRVKRGIDWKWVRPKTGVHCLVVHHSTVGSVWTGQPGRRPQQLWHCCRNA
jgi:hypothetical protein